MSDKEKVQQALAELWDVVKCRCNEAYTGRGLHDPDCECDSAEAVKIVADRIKALTKERDEADDLAKAAFADGASNNIRLAETSYRVKWLEAKLAKAVAFLDKIATTGCWFTSDMNDLLKELKGDTP